MICTGCMCAPVYDHEGNVAVKTCLFCRTLPNKSDEETIKRYEKRIELNDAQAMRIIGCDYAEGRMGLPRDYAKALKLYHKAAELCDADAYNNIASCYMLGRGVEVDEKKAIHYWELAAMGGSVDSRHNFGVTEENKGNWDRAVKHYMIAVKDGGSNSLKNIKIMYEEGHATKDVYDEALKCYQAYVDEIKSDQRDEAAALYGKYY